MISATEVQIMTSQIPAFYEGVEALRTQWEVSRHPIILNEFKAATASSINAVGKMKRQIELIPAYMALGALGIELSPINENRMATVAKDHFMATDGQDIWGSMWRVSTEVTGPLEVAVGVAALYLLHKFRPAMDVIRKGYFLNTKSLGEQEVERHSQPKEETRLNLKEGEKSSRLKKVATKIGSTVIEPAVEASKVISRPVGRVLRVWGIAATTGTFGSTAIEDAARDEYSPKKNAMFAASMVGALMVSNSLLTGGVLLGIREDVPILAEGLDHFVDLVTSPFLLAGVWYGGSFLKRKWIAHKIKEGWKADNLSAEEQIIES